jgi:hypothetical protein
MFHILNHFFPHHFSKGKKIPNITSTVKLIKIFLIWTFFPLNPLQDKTILLQKVKSTQIKKKKIVRLLVNF